MSYISDGVFLSSVVRVTIRLLKGTRSQQILFQNIHTRSQQILFQNIRIGAHDSELGGLWTIITRSSQVSHYPIRISWHSILKSRKPVTYLSPNLGICLQLFSNCSVSYFRIVFTGIYTHLNTGSISIWESIIYLWTHLE